MNKEKQNSVPNGSAKRRSNLAVHGDQSRETRGSSNPIPTRIALGVLTFLVLVLAGAILWRTSPLLGGAVWVLAALRAILLGLPIWRARDAKRAEQELARVEAALDSAQSPKPEEQPAADAPPPGDGGA